MKYMTGVVPSCSGPTGRNFGAGNVGGLAIVCDPSKTGNASANKAMIELHQLTDDVEGVVERNGCPS